MQSVWKYLSLPIVGSRSRQMESPTEEGRMYIDTIKEQTRILVKEIIYYLSSSRNINNTAESDDEGSLIGLGLYGDEIRLAVRQTVDKILTEHKDRMKSAVDSLNFRNIESAASAEVVESVARYCFDGSLNWGRIMTICTFAGLYAKRLIVDVDDDVEEEGSESDQQQQQQLMEAFADSASRHLSNVLAEWILEQGGWENFVEQFSRMDTFVRFLDAFVSLGAFVAKEFILKT